MTRKVSKPDLPEFSSYQPQGLKIHASSEDPPLSELTWSSPGVLTIHGVCLGPVDSFPEPETFGEGVFPEHFEPPAGIFEPKDLLYYEPSESEQISREEPAHKKAPPEPPEFPENFLSGISETRRSVDTNDLLLWSIWLGIMAVVIFVLTHF